MNSKLFPPDPTLSLKDIIDLDNQATIEKINDKKNEKIKDKLISQLLTESIVIDSISKYNNENFFNIDKMDNDFKIPFKIAEFIKNKMVFEINNYNDAYFYIFFKFFIKKIKKGNSSPKPLPFKNNFKTLEYINTLKFFDIRYIDPKDSSLVYLNPNEMDKIEYGMHSINVEKPYSFEMLSCQNCNKYAYLLSIIHNQKIKFEGVSETLSGFYIHHSEKFNRLYSLIKDVLKDFKFVDNDYYNEITENIEKSLLTIKDILSFKVNEDKKYKSSYGKKVYFYDQDDGNYIHMNIIPSISTFRHFNLNFFKIMNVKKDNKEFKDIKIKTHKYHIIGSNENVIGTNSFKNGVQLECSFPKIENKSLNEKAEYVLKNNYESIIDFLIKKETINLNNEPLKIYEIYKDKGGTNLKNSFDIAMENFVSSALANLLDFIEYVFENKSLYDSLDNIEKNSIRNFFKIKANSKENEEIASLIVKSIISKKTFKLNKETYLFDDNFIICLKNKVLSFIKNF